MKYTFRKAFLIGGTALMTLAGGSFAAMAQEATIVFNTNEVGAPTYNPVKASMLNAATGLIYDTLVVQDADQSFHPSLAASWEEAPDGMQWVFHLKKDVKFHDGEPFNAQAIADWIQTYIGTDNQYMVDAIDKVEVVDDLTAKFVMKHPEPNLLFNLSSVFMGVPAPKAYKDLGDNFGVTQAIGTGPTSWKASPSARRPCWSAMTITAGVPISPRTRGRPRSRRSPSAKSPKNRPPSWN